MYHCNLWEEGYGSGTGIAGTKDSILLQPQLGVDISCDNMIELINSGFRNPQVILMERREKVDDDVAEEWRR